MKNCTKCNYENSDDTLFCSECGSSLKEMVFCTDCGGETDADEGFCGHCGSKLLVESEIIGSVDTQKKTAPLQNSIRYINKSFFINMFKGKGKWFAGSVGIVAIILIFTIFNPFSLLEKKQVILYQKDYQLNISKISKPEPVEITKKLWSDKNSNSFSRLETGGTYLSPDKKTLYYMDRTEYDTATFYMMKFKNSNLEKNEAVKIDSKIKINDTYMTKDGKLFIYITGSKSQLMIYNQKESLEIDDKVINFHINDDEKSMYYFNEDGSIYYVALSDIEATNKITSSYATMFIDRDRTLYYTKDGKLYISKSGSDSERLDSDINELIAATADGVYYSKEDQEEVKLKDFVIDDMKAEDAEMNMPIEPNSNDFTERVWVDSYYGGYWFDQVDYNKYQLASDKYYEGMSLWNKKLSRDGLRAELEERAITRTKYSLYFNNGTEDVLITDQFNSYYESAYDINALVYNKYDISSVEKVELSQIYSLSDLEYMVSSTSSESEDLFISIAGSEWLVDQNDFAKCESGDDSIYFLDNYDTEEETGDLKKLTLDKSGGIQTEMVDDDVYLYRVTKETKSLIYFKDREDQSGTLFVDGVEIASDVFTPIVYSVENTDKLLYFKDVEQYGGSLHFYNNGKEIKIADDVSKFQYIDDKTILFLEDYSSSDETYDLMLFDGKETVRIDKDVQYIQGNDYSYMN